MKILNTIIMLTFVGISLIGKTSNILIDKKISSHKEIEITIFVHGIMSIKPHLNATNFVRFMKDEVGDTIYEKTVELMREDPFFFENQIMQEFGMKQIFIDDTSLDDASSVMTRIYDDIWRDATKDNKTEHLYYAYGWSALLSPKRRYFDSKKLFESLVDLLTPFWKKGIKPKLNIVGYSHGGNVCLNLAAIRQDFYPTSPLIVDQLILLGIPIQTENDYLVGDQLFKRVYNIYSDMDRVQPIDFFAYNRFFSRRTFKQRRLFSIPDNLIQVNFRLTRTRKTRYNPCKLKELTGNFCDPSIISGNSRLLRRGSPGHIELWFFGWSPQHYRKNFMLRPLSALVFIPHILHYLKDYEYCLNGTHPVIADIRPDQDTIVFRRKKPSCLLDVVPFVSKQKRDEYTKMAISIKPKKYDLQTFHDHIVDAYTEAVIIKEQERAEELCMRKKERKIRYNKKKERLQQKRKRC